MPLEADKPWVKRAIWAMRALVILLVAAVVYTIARGRSGGPTDTLPERLQQKSPARHVP